MHYGIDTNIEVVCESLKNWRCFEKPGKTEQIFKES